MDGGLDHLMTVLLEDIALCGDAGASIFDVLGYIDSYYAKQFENERLEAAPEDVTNSQLVDRPLQEQIWTWLTSHPEISVGKDGRGNKMSLTEAEKYNVMLPIPPDQTETSSAHTRQELDDASGDRYERQISQDRATPFTQPAKWTSAPVKSKDESINDQELRIYTSQERMWLAIAGHGPDLSRLSRMEFVLLSIIAIYREKGIIQPDITRLSGQDKRSVPRRTDILHKNGYIVKQSSYVRGFRTSHCILKRFTEESAKATMKFLSADEKPSNDNELTDLNDSTLGSVKEMEPTLRKMMSMLNENPLITFNDLKRKLQVSQFQWRSKIIALSVRGMESLGCVQRVMAPSKYGSKHYKCVKLLRMPDEKDWDRFFNLKRNSREPLQTGHVREQEAEKIDDEGYVPDDSAEVNVDRTATMELKISEEEQQSFPAWTTDQPMLNFLHSLIQASGTNGLSTMFLKNHAYGDFYDRPLEHNMSRLVERWQLSQPLHIRHLAVVRDSAITNKIAHYIHYTYEKFKSMVEDGQKIWEAIETITGNEKVYQSSSVAADAVPDLDEYGFPKLDNSRFQGHDNDATFSECIQAAKIRPFTLTGKDPVAIKSNDAGYHIIWDHQHRSRKKSQHPLFEKPEKPLGRPRKLFISALSNNADTLTLAQASKLLQSKKAAMRYQKQKIENQIKERVEDGEKEDEVREDLLAQAAARTDDIVTEVLLAKISPAKRSRRRNRNAKSAVNKKDSVSLPVEDNDIEPASSSQARSQAKIMVKQSLTSYLPSVAAHTIRIPYLAEEFTPSAPTKRVGGRRPKKVKFVLGYLPSVAAHTTSNLRSVVVGKEKLGLSQKPPPRRQNKKVGAIAVDIPTVSKNTVDHDNISLSASTYLSLTPANDSKRSRKRSAKAAELDLHHAIVKKPKRQGKIVETRTKYLPSIAAHTQSLLIHTSSIISNPVTPPPLNEGHERRKKSTKVDQLALNLDSISPGITRTVLVERTRGSMTYEQYSEAVQRDSSGVYVCEPGRVYLARKGCPPKARLVIFKSQRLINFEWFIEDTSPALNNPLSESVQANSLAVPDQVMEDSNNKNAPSLQEVISETPLVPGNLDNSYSLEVANQRSRKSGINLLENQVSSSTSLAGTKRKRTPSSAVDQRPSRRQAFSPSGSTTKAQTSRKQQSPETMIGVDSQSPLAPRPPDKEMEAGRITVTQPSLVEYDSQNNPDAQFDVQYSHSQQLLGDESVVSDLPNARHKAKNKRPTRKQQAKKRISKASKDLLASTAKPIKSVPLAPIPPATLGDVLPPTQQMQALSSHEISPAVSVEHSVQQSDSHPLIDSVKEADNPPEIIEGLVVPSDQVMADYPISSVIDQPKRTSPNAQQLNRSDMKIQSLDRSPVERVDIQVVSEQQDPRNANPSSAIGIHKSSDVGSMKSGAIQKAPKEKMPPSFTRLTPSGGSMAILRKKIILEIVEKCGGVFPADKELWYAFTTSWMAIAGRDAKPDDRTVKMVKKALVDSGKLRQLKFTFLNKNKIATTKSIITLMDIDPTDARVKELERQIITHYPRQFIPKQVDIDKEFVNKPMANQPTIARQKDLQVEENAQVELQYIPAHIRREALNKKAAEERLAEKIKKQQTTPKQHQPKPRVQRLERLKKPSNFTKVGSSLETILNMSLYRNGELLPNLAPFVGMYGPDSDQLLDPELRARAISGIRPRPNDSITLQENDPLMEERHRMLDELAWNCTGFGKAQILPSTISFKEPLGLHSNFDQTPSPESEILEIEAGRPWLLDHTLGQYKPPKNKRNRDLEIELVTSPVRRQSVLGREDNGQRKEKRVCIDPSLTELRAFHQPQGSVLAPRIWEFSTRGPETYDPLFNQQQIPTIMGPDQQFYPSSGTFSTDYVVTRNTRLDPWIHVETPAREFSPSSHELLHSHSQLSQTQPLIVRKRKLGDRFGKEIDDVLAWELKTPELANFKRHGWQFINHRYPGVQEVAEEAVYDIRLLQENQTRLEPCNPPALGLTLAGTPRQRKVAVPKLKTRRLTSLKDRKGPTPLIQGSLNDSEAGSFRKIKTRRPSQFRYFDVEWEKRLMTAIVIVRTLVGGVEQNIDWVLISNIFPPEYNDIFLHQRWVYILQKHRPQLDKLQEDFQKVFIPAYEDGLVPPLDYDNTEAYDWNWLVDWTLERLETFTSELPDLPSDRSRLDQQFNLRPLAEQDMSDLYEINGNASIATRYSIAHRDPYIAPLRSDSRSKPVSRLEIAKSWVKSNIVTPEVHYDSHRARIKLATIGESNIESAVKALLSSKTIIQENKGRLVPGRNYDVSEIFVSRFNKTLPVGDFKNALAYKYQLDASFREKGRAEFSYHANDGSVMAVHNLAAHGRVRIRPVDPPANKFGLMDGGDYRMRTMDKARLHFTISLFPTDTYAYGKPIHPLSSPPFHHPDDLDPALARIPIWYDIRGQVIPIMWDLVLAAVLTVLIARPGVGVVETGKCLKGALEGWEIECVMGWLVDVGVGEWLGGVKFSGVRFGEWWWMCMGSESEGNRDEGPTMGVDGKETRNV